MVRVGGASTSPRRTLIPPPQFQKFHLARPGGAHCFPFGADFLRETAEAASLCAGPCSGLWWSEKQRNQITGRLHGSRSPPEESVFQVFPCLRWRACAPEIPALQRPTLHPPASETWVWGKHARSADSTLSRTRFRWLYFSLILCCVTLFLFPSVDQFIWNQEKKWNLLFNLQISSTNGQAVMWFDNILKTLEGNANLLCPRKPNIVGSASANTLQFLHITISFWKCLLLHLFVTETLIVMFLHF